MAKKPQDWDESDLQKLIANKIEENIELEYKGSDSLENQTARKPK